MYIPEVPSSSNPTSVFRNGAHAIMVGGGDRYEYNKEVLTNRLLDAGWVVLHLEHIDDTDWHRTLEISADRIRIVDILYVMREDDDDELTTWAIKYAKAIDKPVYYVYAVKEE